MTMDMNIVCRFDSSRSCASDKSWIRTESSQSLPRFFQLVWAKPSHCNCLFLLQFFLLLHTACRPFPASRIVWLIKTRLINFFGKIFGKIKCEKIIAWRQLAHKFSSASRCHESMGSLETLKPLRIKFQSAGPNHARVKSLICFWPSRTQKNLGSLRVHVPHYITTITNCTLWRV